MDGDRQRLERCLAQVVADRASGLKARAWALAHRVELRALQNWCAHANQWRARLDGVALAPPSRPSGFAAVQAPTSTCIWVELAGGAGRVDLHWSLSHARDLATWLVAGLPWQRLSASPPMPIAVMCAACFGGRNCAAVHG